MPQSVVLREANNCAVRISKGAPLMDRESISMHGGAVAIPANIDLEHRRDIEQSFADIAAHAGELLALGHVVFDVVGRPVIGWSNSSGRWFQWALHCGNKIR